MAPHLLLGASVYRLPVEETALVWQVGDVPELPVQGTKEAFPEVAAPAGFAAARAALEEAGLLAPYAVSDEDAVRFAVHRWTASALAARSAPDEFAAAHLRAARYWWWRVRTVSKDLEEGMEARYHFHQAGELDDAVSVTETVCLQLDTWGAYRREEQLCREVLGWLPPRSDKAAGFTLQLGFVAQKRGSYEEAFEWFWCSRQIFEEMGNRPGMAASYHHLGWVAQERGSYDEALEWYRNSLQIEEELGNRDGMATSYHHLGWVAQLRGSYEEALEWYRRSLPIREELGNRDGMATSYHNMGMVAQLRGSYEEALEWHRNSLQIRKELGNRDGMAVCYHQMGIVALECGSYEDALEWSRGALRIFDELGNRSGKAHAYGQMGVVAHKRGSHENALEWYRESLRIFEELGNRAGMALSMSNIGALLTERGAPEDAVPWNLRSLSIRLEIRVPQVRIDLHLLGRQRELLGDARFCALVAEHEGEEAVEAVVGVIEQAAAMGGGSEGVDAG
jgi:tetratricopeptide (TPR) repeat protein